MGKGGEHTEYGLASSGNIFEMLFYSHKSIWRLDGTVHGYEYKRKLCPNACCSVLVIYLAHINVR